MNEYQFKFEDELYYTNIAGTFKASPCKVIKAAVLFPSVKAAYNAVLDRTTEIENAEVYKDAKGLPQVKGILNGMPFCTEEPEATPIDEVINVVEEAPVVEEEEVVVEEEPEDESRNDYLDILKVATIPWCQELQISPDNVNPVFCQAHGWRFIKGCYVMDIIREGKRYIFDEGKQQLVSLRL